MQISNELVKEKLNNVKEHLGMISEELSVFSNSYRVVCNDLKIEREARNTCEALVLNLKNELDSLTQLRSNESDAQQLQVKSQNNIMDALRQELESLRNILTLEISTMKSEISELGVQNSDLNEHVKLLTNEVEFYKQELATANDKYLLENNKLLENKLKLESLLNEKA